MKLSFVAAFIASIVAVSLVLRKRQAFPGATPAEANKRYDIDEYIGEEEL